MAEERDLTDVLEEALHAWLEEHGGGMLTGYVFCANYMDGEGEHAWVWSSARGQSMFTTLGLSEWMVRVVEAEAKAYLDGITGG